MAFMECAWEQDVVDAIVSGRWPDGGELEDHVRACRGCADLAVVLGPLLDARDTTWQDARVPSSGVVWWRAQMRARREATRSANRPLTIAEIGGLLAAVAVLLGMAMAASPWLGPVAGRAVELARLDGVSLALPTLSDLAGYWWVLLVAGPWLILGPMAIYFAMADD